MPTPRKPTETLKLTGAYANNPGKLAAQRPAEPVGYQELPDPPAHLPARDAAVWREVSETMHKRVTAGADVHAFEILIRLITIMRYEFATMTAAQIAQMRGYLNDFGMTPSSRSKVRQAPEAKTDDPWDEFGKATKQ